MSIDNKLLFECKLLKQIVYKTKNQLGKTLQFRRLMHVYRSLKNYIKGEFIENFEEIIEKAGISVMDSLMKKFLVPVFTALLGAYARIYYIITTSSNNHTTKIISRKLKTIIKLSKSFKKQTHHKEKKKIKEIESFLESIRCKV
ncbi:hypothetical protein SteCoe_31731 [Stentor coeruleus]|uniref:Uncharacterized protein n=1 Tax=Stentor coeruleus TaxID=5963 RepID=A0A1R2B0P0_9CILI|nr:hypothetical protein SteCoe_31731 [Stentor coeruleus]